MSYRFAIVGCGKIAQRHAACISQVGLLEAVCDINPEKSSALALKYNASAYFSMQTMLEEVKPTVVCICTPNGLHADQSILALSHKCHVLCEKPMAISSVDSQRMCEAAREFGQKLYIVKQNRFNPPVVLLKDLLVKGKLGEVHSFQVNCFWNRPEQYYQNDWHGSLSLDGGTLYTQFSHFIDLIWWLFGPLDEVKGWRSNDLHKGSIEFEDNGACMLRMKNGTKGSLQYSINSYRKNMEGSITVFGEKGTIKIGGQYLNQLEYFEVEGEILPVLPNDPGPNNYGFYQGSMSNHSRVYEELLKALDSTVTTIVDSKEASNTIEMIEKIYANSPFIPPQHFSL